MNKKIKIGIIGLGPRGMGLLRSSVLPLCGEELELAVLCDSYSDRLEEAAKEAEKALGTRPMTTDDSEEALSSGIDAVIIASGWESHLDIAISAMKKGVIPE